MLRSKMMSILQLKTGSIFRYVSSCSEVIRSEVKTCGIITLNRESALHSFNFPMIKAMDAAFLDYNDDPKISHIIFEAVGNKAFCAGGDVVSVVNAVKSGNRLSKDFFLKEYQLEYFTAHVNKPTIALVDGLVMGGGVGISVHNRFRVATNRSMFAMPEASIGLFTDAGGGFFLPRLKHDGLGLYLALTGHRLLGSDALWSGFATHFMHHNKVAALKDALVNMDINPEENVSDSVDKVLRNFHEKSAITKPELDDFMDLIARFYGKDGVGVSGTMEILIKMLQDALLKESKGSSIAIWIINQLEVFNKLSPTSLKVILRQLQLGRKLSLIDNFKMEYRLSQRICQTHDFTEGVRAALIDKDHSPKWNPSSLAEVKEEVLDDFFKPLPKRDEWAP